MDTHTKGEVFKEVHCFLSNIQYCSVVTVQGVTYISGCWRIACSMRACLWHPKGRKQSHLGLLLLESLGSTRSFGNNEVDWEQLLLCTGSDIIKAKSEVKSVKQNSSVRTAFSKKLDGSEWKEFLYVLYISLQKGGLTTWPLFPSPSSLFQVGGGAEISQADEKGRNYFPLPPSPRPLQSRGGFWRMPRALDHEGMTGGERGRWVSASKRAEEVCRQILIYDTMQRLPHIKMNSRMHVYKNMSRTLIAHRFSPSTH